MEEKNIPTFEERMAILTAPFKEPKWRIQSRSPKGKPTRCNVMPYVDARMVQERFDAAFGADNWQNTYDPETGSASISVRVDGEWITKSDVGVESMADKEKGKASSAFKRAAVLWGVGRDLYRLGIKTLNLDSKGEDPIVENGIILKNAVAISNYMNKISESVGLLYQLWNLNKDKWEDSDFKDLFIKIKKYVE